MQTTRNTTIYVTSWLVILSVFWLLLSGFLKPLLLCFGVVSVVFVVFVLRRMDTFDQQPQQLALNVSFFLYIGWLLRQVCSSSLEVVRLVWNKNNKLSPAVVKLPVDTIPAETRVLYANSITLTPGTLSVDIDDEHVTVHGLVEESLEELKEGEMANRVAALAGGNS